MTVAFVLELYATGILLVALTFIAGAIVGSLGVCPKCFRYLRRRRGELYCARCGYSTEPLMKKKKEGDPVVELITPTLSGSVYSGKKYRTADKGGSKFSRSLWDFGSLKKRR